MAGAAEEPSVGGGVVVCLELDTGCAAALADEAVALDEHGSEGCLGCSVPGGCPVAGGVGGVARRVVARLSSPPCWLDAEDFVEAPVEFVGVDAIVEVVVDQP
jgi:hypothetical protein